MTGRPKEVTGSRVVEIIRESDKPYATTTDIAESLDVTAQAVRDNAARLSMHSELEDGSVGRATVYYLSQEEQQSDEDETGTDGQNPALAERVTVGKDWMLTALTALVGLTFGALAGIIIGNPSTSTAVVGLAIILALFGLVAVLILFRTSQDVKDNPTGETA